MAGIANAGTITATGAELVGESGVSFPTIAPTVTGDSIHFGTGFNNPVLIRWDLFPANTLTAGSPTTTITLTGNATRTSSDFDFTVGLWDGVHNVSMFPLVDGSRIFNNTNATSDGTTQSESPVSQVGTASPTIGIGESFDFTMIWTLGAGSTEVYLSVLDFVGSYTTTNPFDRTSPLAILFAKQSSSEEFQLNSISISSDLIDGNAVPLPAAFPLYAAAIAGLGFVRRRQKRA